MATNCFDTLLFGQVCDDCHGGAVFKIIIGAFNIVSAGILVLATIGIIMFGVKIMTARDSAEQMAKAKKRLLEIVIGLVAYALMFVGANLIIPGGIMNMSTLADSGETCPDTVTATPSTPSTPIPSEPENPGGESESTDGYPWATIVGQTPAGDIQCPRNAGRTYITNPNSSNTKYDKFYQSIAQSCPFTKVQYTKNTDDLACAPGGTMHYATVVNEKRKNGSIVKETMGPFCLVNSKIDVGQYQNYLVENYVSQDNKLCTSSGECVDGGKDSPFGVREYFYCDHFSYTFTANLNNGEVISNDALASKAGTAFQAAAFRLTTQGNLKTTWNGRDVAVYDDALSGIKINPDNPTRLPYPELSTVYSISDTLNTLRQGKAVTVMTRGEGWGHYITAVGFTKDCAIGSTSPCTYDDIIFLDSTYGTTLHVNYAKITNANTPNPNDQFICTQEKCKKK